MGKVMRVRAQEEPNNHIQDPAPKTDVTDGLKEEHKGGSRGRWGSGQALGFQISAHQGPDAHRGSSLTRGGIQANRALLSSPLTYLAFGRLSRDLEETMPSAASAMGPSPA